MRRGSNLLKISGLGVALFALIACSKSGETESVYTPSSESPSVEYHHLDVNSFKLNNIVCDPMSAPGNPGLGDGLIAELFYLNAGDRTYSGVQDFIDKGIRSNQKLFFSSVNVPTRVFDTGFPTQAGSMVQNDQGEDLIEYFALRFKSVLKLGPDDEEGDYELALLSDDGAVLRILEIDGTETVAVDNDGIHPSQFGCGNQTIAMNSQTALDIRLDYFQGPRHHISLIPMWRKVDSHTKPEKECGKQGNGRYFQFNNNSEPQKHYLDLLERGWKPIAAQNWQMPLSSIFNPCKDGTPAKISNLAVDRQGETALVVTWETDLMSTSQVLLREENGNEIVTDSDNVLRTSHRVVIENLNVGETYIVQGISITQDLGKTLSRVLQITL